MTTTEPPTRSRSVDELVAALSLDEKAALTAGADFWSTVAIERLGVPAVGLSDGPNGARGPFLMGQSPLTSACVPCGTALGATWDPLLVERVGEMLGQEARSKACRVLLAPTVNIHRSPIAGRNFECYSEDPLLTGRLAAALVRGVQSQGVATTVKHLVANEAETERNTMSSVVDERSLREIYLVPFELAVKEGGTLGVMTSYNRLNGEWCAERPDLLAGILRGEWGFEGFVLTDWFAVASTVVSARAGVDLEMPGPGRAFGEALAEAVRGGELDETVVDEQVRRLLTVFERLGALDVPADTEAGSGEDDVPAEPQAIDRPEHRALAREAACASMVLLRNDGVLPLDRSALRRVAVIGPNATRAVVMGGGSAQVTPHYRVTPLDALGESFGRGVDVVYEPGVDFDVAARRLGIDLDVQFFGGSDLGRFDEGAEAGEPVYRTERTGTELLWFGRPDRSVRDPFVLRAQGVFEPTTTGPHRFTLAQSGRARLRIDGEVVLDGVADPPPPGTSFFGVGSVDVETHVDLEAGRPVTVAIEYSSEDSPGLYGVRVGCQPVPPPDLLDRAVTAAAEADVAVVVVGTTKEWEAEGFDRTSMDLPGVQDALVSHVAAANPRTVVVVNTGSPVTMPWVDQVGSVLQIWFGGQEMAGALADVLLGQAEPGGRLPTTFPRKLQHNPSYGTFPGANDENRYGEGLLVGYRWYDTRERPPRFPFGHGLPYTTFELGSPVLSAASFAPGGEVVVDVPVSNTGSRRGSEVVQCYVAPDRPRVFRPFKELRAFAKVTLDPGESETVRLVLGDRAFAYWDPGPGEHAALQARVPSAVGRLGPDGDSDGTGGDAAREPGWRVDPGTYELHVGRSSTDITFVVPIEVEVPS